MVFEAFNIISVVEDVNSDLEAAGQISAIESSGSDLFLGTTRGCLLRYQYHVDQSSIASSVLLTHCALNNSGAVRCMCLASALEKLVVLTADGCLQTLDAPTLMPADRFQRMRGVSTMTLNHNPSTADPFSIQICVARRGQLSVCDVTVGGLRVLSDLDVGDTVVSVAFSGDVLCVVAAGRYLVLRVNSDVRQQLFDFDPTVLSPLVGAFKQGEFLVLGPANLALFASAAGTTERPPLQLTHDPRSWALLPPYLITTDSHTVAYVSLEDETRRGQLSVPGAAHVGNFDGTLFLCVGGSVLSLHTVSTDVQLETLLACGDVSAAMSLLDRCDGFDPSPPAARCLGLQLLARGQAAKALKLLLTAGLTPIQMVSLVVDSGFPRPADWDAEHEALLKLVPALSDVDPDAVQSCVTEYLLRTAESVKHEQAVRELALLLLLRCDYDEDTIRRYLNSCSSTSYSEATSCLIPPLDQHPVERARLLWISGGGGDDGAVHPCGDATHRDLNRVGAMDLWKDVLEQRVHGDRDVAAEHMKRALISVRGLALVRQYADVLLEYNQLLGVTVFTCRDSDSQLTFMSVDDVISYLRRHPLALAVYLRHLLDTQPEPSEQVGTQLASLYVDQIARQRHLSDTAATTPSDVADDVRGRLLQLVRSEIPLKCSALLHRTVLLQLDAVSAHLCCRLGEYDKAMELISTVGGTDSAMVSMDRIPGALQFIDEVASSITNAAPLVETSINTAASLRSRLYSSLLTICLRNADSDATCALYVLNSCDYSCSDLDPVRTLSQLSGQWRLSVLSPFLQSVVRTAVRRQHTARQLRALASCQLTGQQLQLAGHRGTAVCVQQDSVCAVCRGRLSCSDVAVGCEDAAGFGYHDNGTSGDPVVVHPGCVPHGDVPSCSAPSS